MSEAIFGVEVEREDDGRWLAEVLTLPGVMVYGQTREEALANVKALALRVLADRVEHGEAVMPRPRVCGPVTFRTTVG